MLHLSALQNKQFIKNGEHYMAYCTGQICNDYVAALSIFVNRGKAVLGAAMLAFSFCKALEWGKLLPRVGNFFPNVY